ncbi:MAG TPA: gfo/Idh/MocA family oxidoreductase, partial [Clostridia bacterium]|nr:gfo/Idh/MocA family oxidoreductase [Clostridia bacterium]
VKILEAIMVQHHPWQKYLADMAESQVYGRLKEIKTQVSFLPKENFKGNYRTLPECGGGAFFDLGPYWLQLLQCFGDVSEAEYAGASCFDGPNGCDWTFNANLKLNNGINAEFAGSFEQSYQASHELIFEKAKVRMEDFYRANFANLKVALTIEDYKNNSKETIFFPPQNYYVNQLKFFSEVIDGIRENIDPLQTYKRILVMEGIYENAKRAFKKKKRVVNNEEI